MIEEYIRILVAARKDILATAYGNNPLSAGIAFTINDMISQLDAQRSDKPKLTVVK